MSGPNFIIIGVIKGGTSALWHNLDKHPEIKMCRQNTENKIFNGIEINFWRHNRKKGLDWYNGLFNYDLICGEKCAGYFSNRSALKSIIRELPDVKLIVMMRNPADRIYSAFNMRFKLSQSPIEFHGYVINNNPLIEKYIKQCNYVSNIKYILECGFNKDKLYTGITERMRNNTNIELKKIFRFIDVDDNFNLDRIEVPRFKAHKKGMTMDEVNKNKFFQVWQSPYKPMLLETRQILEDKTEGFKQDFFDYLGYEIEEWYKNN